MSATILVEGLRFAYPPLTPEKAAPWVFDGLDLQVAPGEWLAVMGANDTGKTTLCLILAGLAPHLTDGLLEGRVVIAGRNTLDHPPPGLADTVGVLFQEPEAQIFNPTVEAEVAWGPENLGLPPAEIRARIDEMLALLRLDHVRRRDPHTLSGGEKKRLALASILVMQPQVLILDEPMGGLDPAGRREVLHALASLRVGEGIQPVTIVMTESDPEAVTAFADRLLVLPRPSPLDESRQRQIALSGPPRDVLRQVDVLTAQGVSTSQMARLAAELSRHLGTDLNFLTVDEAGQTLARMVPLV